MLLDKAHGANEERQEWRVSKAVLSTVVDTCGYLSLKIKLKIKFLSLTFQYLYLASDYLMEDHRYKLFP